MFLRHIRESGHTLCHCSGYHYAHRKGSTYCEANPWAIYHEASRRGATNEELDDLRLEIVMESGTISKECPF